MSLKLPKRFKLASPSHARAKVMEKVAAKRIGGRQTKGSGSSYEKGDVRLKRVARLECKTTKHASFSVTAAMIEKIEQAVMGADEVPILEVELLGGERRVYVVPAWAMDDLLNPKGNQK